MKTFYLFLLFFGVAEHNALVELKNPLPTNDSSVLMTILQSVDAATSDEHLFQVTLKLLKSLCVCMRDTLKKKEVNTFNGDTNSLANNDLHGGDNELDLYKKIYNNTCFNLKQKIVNKINKLNNVTNHAASIDDKNFENKTENSGEVARNKTKSELENILFKILIQTKDYHNFKMKRYNLFGKAKTFVGTHPTHSIIVILTLHPTRNVLDEKIEISDVELNKTIFSKSAIDIDINDARYDPTEKESVEDPETDMVLDCNLRSVYVFLVESERKNLTKIFKLLRKNGTIKIYIDVTTLRNHVDYSSICCNNYTNILSCEKTIKENIKLDDKNTDRKSSKNIGNYRDTVSKIKSLIKLYDKRVHNENILHGSFKDNTVGDYEKTNNCIGTTHTNETELNVKYDTDFLKNNLPPIKKYFKMETSTKHNTLNKSFLKVSHGHFQDKNNSTPVSSINFDYQKNEKRFSNQIWITSVSKKSTSPVVQKQEKYSAPNYIHPTRVTYTKSFHKNTLKNKTLELYTNMETSTESALNLSPKIRINQYTDLSFYNHKTIKNNGTTIMNPVIDVNNVKNASKFNVSMNLANNSVYEMHENDSTRNHTIVIESTTRINGQDIQKSITKPFAFHENNTIALLEVTSNINMKTSPFFRPISDDGEIIKYRYTPSKPDKQQHNETISSKFHTNALAHTIAFYRRYLKHKNNQSIRTNTIDIEPIAKTLKMINQLQRNSTAGLFSSNEKYSSVFTSNRNIKKRFDENIYTDPNITTEISTLGINNSTQHIKGKYKYEDKDKSDSVNSHANYLNPSTQSLLRSIPVKNDMESYGNNIPISTAVIDEINSEIEPNLDNNGLTYTTASYQSYPIYAYDQSMKKNIVDIEPVPKTFTKIEQQHQTSATGLFSSKENNISEFSSNRNMKKTFNGNIVHSEPNITMTVNNSAHYIKSKYEYDNIDKSDSMYSHGNYLKPSTHFFLNSIPGYKVTENNGHTIPIPMPMMDASNEEIAQKFALAHSITSYPSHPIYVNDHLIKVNMKPMSKMLKKIEQQHQTSGEESGLISSQEKYTSDFTSNRNRKKTFHENVYTDPYITTDMSITEISYNLKNQKNLDKYDDEKGKNDSMIIHENNLSTKPLLRSIPAYNVDANYGIPISIIDSFYEENCTSALNQDSTIHAQKRLFGTDILDTNEPLIITKNKEPTQAPVTRFLRRNMMTSSNKNMKISNDILRTDYNIIIEMSTKAMNFSTENSKNNQYFVKYNSNFSKHVSITEINQMESTPVAKLESYEHTDPKSLIETTNAAIASNINTKYLVYSVPFYQTPAIILHDQPMKIKAKPQTPVKAIFLSHYKNSVTSSEEKYKNPKIAFNMNMKAPDDILYIDPDMTKEISSQSWKYNGFTSIFVKHINPNETSRIMSKSVDNIGSNKYIVPISITKTQNKVSAFNFTTNDYIHSTASHKIQPVHLNIKTIPNNFNIKEKLLNTAGTVFQIETNSSKMSNESIKEEYPHTSENNVLKSSEDNLFNTNTIHNTIATPWMTKTIENSTTQSSNMTEITQSRIRTILPDDTTSFKSNNKIQYIKTTIPTASQQDDDAILGIDFTSEIPLDRKIEKISNSSKDEASQVNHSESNFMKITQNIPLKNNVTMGSKYLLNNREFSTTQGITFGFKKSMPATENIVIGFFNKRKLKKYERSASSTHHLENRTKRYFNAKPKLLNSEISAHAYFKDHGYENTIPNITKQSQIMPLLTEITPKTYIERTTKATRDFDIFNNTIKFMPNKRGVIPTTLGWHSNVLNTEKNTLINTDYTDVTSVKINSSTQKMQQKKLFTSSIKDLAIILSPTLNDQQTMTSLPTKIFLDIKSETFHTGNKYLKTSSFIDQTFSENNHSENYENIMASTEPTLYNYSKQHFPIPKVYHTSMGTNWVQFKSNENKRKNSKARIYDVFKNTSPDIMYLTRTFSSNNTTKTFWRTKPYLFPENQYYTTVLSYDPRLHKNQIEGSLLERNLEAQKSGTTNEAHPKGNTSQILNDQKTETLVKKLKTDAGILKEIKNTTVASAYYAKPNMAGPKYTKRTTILFPATTKSMLKLITSAHRHPDIKIRDIITSSHNKKYIPEAAIAENLKYIDHSKKIVIVSEIKENSVADSFYTKNSKAVTTLSLVQRSLENKPASVQSVEMIDAGRNLALHSANLNTKRQTMKIKNSSNNHTAEISLLPRKYKQMTTTPIVVLGSLNSPSVSFKINVTNENVSNTSSTKDATNQNLITKMPYTVIPSSRIQMKLYTKTPAESDPAIKINRKVMAPKTTMTARPEFIYHNRINSTDRNPSKYSNSDNLERTTTIKSLMPSYMLSQEIKTEKSDETVNEAYWFTTKGANTNPILSYISLPFMQLLKMSNETNLLHESSSTEFKAHLQSVSKKKYNSRILKTLKTASKTLYDNTSVESFHHSRVNVTHLERGILPNTDFQVYTFTNPIINADLVTESSQTIKEHTLRTKNKEEKLAFKLKGVGSNIFDKSVKNLGETNSTNFNKKSYRIEPITSSSETEKMDVNSEHFTSDLLTDTGIHYHIKTNIVKNHMPATLVSKLKSEISEYSSTESVIVKNQKVNNNDHFKPSFDIISERVKHIESYDKNNIERQTAVVDNNVLSDKNDYKLQYIQNEKAQEETHFLHTKKLKNEFVFTTTFKVGEVSKESTKSTINNKLLHQTGIHLETYKSRGVSSVEDATLNYHNFITAHLEAMKNTNHTLKIISKPSTYGYIQTINKAPLNNKIGFIPTIVMIDMPKNTTNESELIEDIIQRPSTSTVKLFFNKSYKKGEIISQRNPDKLVLTNFNSTKRNNSDYNLQKIPAPKSKAIDPIDNITNRNEIIPPVTRNNTTNVIQDIDTSALTPQRDINERTTKKLDDKKSQNAVRTENQSVSSINAINLNINSKFAIDLNSYKTTNSNAHITPFKNSIGLKPTTVINVFPATGSVQISSTSKSFPRMNAIIFQRQFTKSHQIDSYLSNHKKIHNHLKNISDFNNKIIDPLNHTSNTVENITIVTNSNTRYGTEQVNMAEDGDDSVITTQNERNLVITRKVKNYKSGDVTSTESILLANNYSNSALNLSFTGIPKFLLDSNTHSDTAIIENITLNGNSLVLAAAKIDFKKAPVLSSSTAKVFSRQINDKIPRKYSSTTESLRTNHKYGYNLKASTYSYSNYKLGENIITTYTIEDSTLNENLKQNMNIHGSSSTKNTARSIAENAILTLSTNNTTKKMFREEIKSITKETKEIKYTTFNYKSVNNIKNEIKELKRNNIIAKDAATTSTYDFYLKRKPPKFNSKLNATRKFKTIKYNTYKPITDEDFDVSMNLINNKSTKVNLYKKIKSHIEIPLITNTTNCKLLKNLSRDVMKAVRNLDKLLKSSNCSTEDDTRILVRNKEVNNSNIISNNGIKYEYRNLNPKRRALLDPFSKTNLYPIKMVPPKIQRKVMKRIQLSNRKKEILTMNTKDFFSHRHGITQRNVINDKLKVRPKSLLIHRRTSIPKKLVLKPKFQSIDNPAKPKPSFFRPKPLFLNDDDFYREDFHSHHKPKISWREKVNFVQEALQKPKEEELTSRDNILERPFLPSVAKPTFLRDRIDSIRSYLFNADFVRSTRRAPKEYFMKPFNSKDQYDPLDFYHRLNWDDEQATMETTKAKRTRRTRRTLFFLSPTEPFHRYF